MASVVSAPAQVDAERAHVVPSPPSSSFLHTSEQSCNSHGPPFIAILLMPARLLSSTGTASHPQDRCDVATLRSAAGFYYIACGFVFFRAFRSFLRGGVWVCVSRVGGKWCARGSGTNPERPWKRCRGTCPRCSRRRRVSPVLCTCRVPITLFDRDTYLCSSSMQLVEMVSR